MQNGKQCPCCGKRLADSAFYKSFNPKHKDKLTPMCKKCCINQSLDDTGANIDIDRFKNTLHFNDKPYRTELHRAVILQAEKKYSDDGGKTKAETIVGLYFGKLSSLYQYKNMTWNDSTFSAASTQIENAFINNTEKMKNMLKSALYNYLLDQYGNKLAQDYSKQCLEIYVDARIESEQAIADNDMERYLRCKNIMRRMINTFHSGVFADSCNDWHYDQASKELIWNSYDDEFENGTIWEKYYIMQ